MAVLGRVLLNVRWLKFAAFKSTDGVESPTDLGLFAFDVAWKQRSRLFPFVEKSAEQVTFGIEQDAQLLGCYCILRPAKIVFVGFFQFGFEFLHFGLMGTVASCGRSHEIFGIDLQ